MASGIAYCKADRFNGSLCSGILRQQTTSFVILTMNRVQSPELDAVGNRVTEMNIGTFAVILQIITNLNDCSYVRLTMIYSSLITARRSRGVFYTDNTLFTVLPNSPKVNLKYLLALFNSHLLNFIYHFISQESGKSQAQVKISVVNRLPVVIPAEEQQRLVIALVDEILSAKDSNPEEDTTKLENKIDQIVYSLYDLTPDEIAIVEAAENV